MTITVLDESFPEEEGLDTAVSRALLVEASNGQVGETFRLHVPGRVVAFGKHDALADGYPMAVDAARRHGFQAVERLAGGRAAVFHELTLSFSWTIPAVDPTSGVTGRFEMLSELMVAAFGRLGIAAAIGEVAGEYCPGRYSVHHEGRLKLMGVGQRLTRGGAHIGGVIAVGRSDLINRPLGDVYASLGIEFDPSVTGSLQDLDPTITIDDTRRAVLAELGAIRPTRFGTLGAESLALARRLCPDHVATGTKAENG